MRMGVTTLPECELQIRMGFATLPTLQLVFAEVILLKREP